MSGIPDVENQIFTECEAAIRRVDPDVLCKGAEEYRPPSLPFASIVEDFCAVYSATADSACRENHTLLRYRVDVYTNDTAGKKARCKRIMAAVREYFGEIGFYRTLCQPIPNLSDPDVYRMTATFEAVMDKNKRLYRQ